nr:glycosyltransferase family 2 protein [Palleronia caenipelagi]
MGLFNGECFLQDQLDSFVAQTHEDWELIVSDDGSTDAGLDILRTFAADHPNRNIRLIAGPQQGVAKNFLYLLGSARGDYISFADQDDVWLPHKIARALAQLPDPQIPALICGRTRLVDENLNELGLSQLFTQTPSFGNALVENIGGGNTMVMTQAAADLLNKARAHVQALAVHDWWAYQVLTGCGAQVIYDPEPGLLYRQHSQNLIGGGRSSKVFLDRMRRVFIGQVAQWADQTIANLTPVRDLTAGNRARLTAFSKARGASMPNRIRLMRQSGITRQKLIDRMALWAAVLWNRI